VGLNLNPDQRCNFDCIYCQVDRRSPLSFKELEPEVLLQELDETLDQVTSGALYRVGQFATVPAHLRRLNDIAFSGDGEPTAAAEFQRVVEDVAALKRRRGLEQVKLILITNATMFHRPRVKAGLEILDANQGEIWAKLDAGTGSYYRSIDRSSVPFDQILANLLDAARRRPLVIQSLFLTLDRERPSGSAIDAYVQRLADLIADGGKIASVQVYTVARRPADERVGPLPAVDLERIGATIRQRVGTTVEVFP
jgi:wyosine [tRNA(Phe)-imidazoG37] synthetase (radical SAM superfamily)